MKKLLLLSLLLTGCVDEKTKHLECTLLDDKAAGWQLVKCENEGIVCYESLHMGISCLRK